MKLEDYVPSAIQEYGWTDAKESYSFIPEIRSYNNISREKKELFESIPKYLTYFFYCSDLDYDLHHNTTYIQSRTNNGDRVLVKFPIVSSYKENEERGDDVVRVSREELERRKRKYVNVGEQFYTHVNLNSILGIIIITKDGHVFADKELADKIAKTDINKIADELYNYYIANEHHIVEEKDAIYTINNHLRYRGELSYSSKDYTIEELMIKYGQIKKENHETTSTKKKTKKKFFNFF